MPRARGMGLKARTLRGKGSSPRARIPARYPSWIKLSVPSTWPSPS